MTSHSIVALTSVHSTFWCPSLDLLEVILTMKIFVFLSLLMQWRLTESNILNLSRNHMIKTITLVTHLGLCQSCISNYKQFLSVAHVGFSSTALSGVHRGSILGHLLFNLFMHDFSDSVGDDVLPLQITFSGFIAATFLYITG